MQVGQPLIAINSDPIMHNVHTKPEHQRGQNRGQPPGSPPMDVKLRRPEVMVEVRCDVHAWMKAWIGVVPHPFFGVTDLTGTFKLERVPPGVHTLRIWHEEYGELEQTVTVEAGAVIEANFSFD